MKNFSVTPQGGFLMIEFRSQPILNAAVAEATGEELRQLAAGSPGKSIVLDLGAVKLMTSAMIGEFMKLNRICEEKGIKLVFFNLSSDLMSVIKLCRLENVFRIAGSREEVAKVVASGPVTVATS